MRQDNIYQLAIDCKKLVDEELKSKITNNSGKFIYGRNNSLKAFLPKLCNAIKDKYPSIYNDLQNHIDNYDANHYSSIDVIKELVDCIIDAETSKAVNKANSKKIFISHATDDETIIKAFITEILIMGCGFKPNDIFCTLDHTSIRTGDYFRDEIISNMKCCDFVFCFISENYRISEACQNELGAAWAMSLDEKRVLPFKFPNVSFNEMGFLNVVKQCADITDKTKLDELYGELCEYYGFKQDWKNYNQRTADYIDIVNKAMS